VYHAQNNNHKLQLAMLYSQGPSCLTLIGSSSGAHLIYFESCVFNTGNKTSLGLAKLCSFDMQDAITPCD
jgi:hypothetical protein